MKASVVYNGLSSLVSASVLIKNNVEVELMLPYEPANNKAGDFDLSPYELPIIGVDHRDYVSDLFSFIGAEEVKKYFLPEKELINIVFGSNKIDLSSGTILEDISRLFPEQIKPVTGFLSDIRAIEKKNSIVWNKRGIPFGNNIKRKIVQLYDKHKLSQQTRSIFDSVLFVASGSITDDFPLVEAARVIVSALDGVLVPAAGTHSLSHSMMKILKDSFQLGKMGEYDKKNTVVDADVVKQDFVSGFLQFDNKYSSQIRYPMSMFFKVNARNIPSSASKYIIYIDVDDSGFYTPDDIYVLTNVLDGDKANLRITAFLPYGVFDINNDGHRERLFVMKHIIQDLFPALSVTEYPCYPNPEDVNLKQELEQMFCNMVENDLVYGNIYENKRKAYVDKRSFFCGREPLYRLGFEASVINGARAANSLIRSLKR